MNPFMNPLFSLFFGLFVCYAIGYYLFGKSSDKIAKVAGWLGSALAIVGFLGYYFYHVRAFGDLAYAGVSLINCWVVLNVASGLADVKKRRGIFEYMFDKS